MCLSQGCSHVSKIKTSSIYTPPVSAGFEARGVCGRSHTVVKDRLPGLPKLLDLEWKPPLPWEQQNAQKKGGTLQAGQIVKFFNEEKNFFVLFLFFFREGVREQNHFRCGEALEKA